MRVPSRHILQQGPVLSALARTAWLALRQRAAAGAPPEAPPATPGPEVHRSRAPLPRRLIDDYVRHLGGDPRAYRGEVPPHLFPQWCMPALARTLEGLPYPLLRVVNGGCKVRVRAPIADGEPLEVRARLQDIDDDGRRAVLHQRVTTGTRTRPDALDIDFYAIVPLPRAPSLEFGGFRPPPRLFANPPRFPCSLKGEHPSGVARKPQGIRARRDPTTKTAELEPSDAQPAEERPVAQDKPRPRVAPHAREIHRARLSRDAGLSFAKLTGDFNPIHWIAPYARASGFPDVILHGFGSLALCWEALVRHLCSGDVHAIVELDARFTRPLVLPHEVGVYVQQHEVFVGDALNGPAYLTGSFATRGKT